jgi:hypothetical protein
MAMKWFVNPTTLEELKAQYKKLAFANHPDMGGSTETMQEINAEYEILCGELATVHKNAAGEFYRTSADKAEAPAEFIDIIEKLIHMAGITVELCGSWLWVTGDTRPHKDALKGMGFKWSSNKTAWYFHHGAYAKRGKMKTLDEIREMFGSERFESVAGNGREVIPA